MALNETEQIIKAIKESRHILIVFPREFNPDSAGSALALYLALKKQDILADIASAGFILPKNLKFLPQAEAIKPEINNLQKFVITVETGQDKIENLSYNLENDKLKIYLTAKSGSFNKDAVKAENSDYKYDLIVSLDAPDLDSLGAIYQNFTEFFYNTTIINLDHKAENEHFGQINLTNPNAAATAEILFNLLNEIDKNLIDREIATCLLTGLVAKTRSFKTSNVTPKTLEIAGRLMSAEADRDAIIKNLYRSRSVSTLNLWGRALARLKSQDGNKLTWSLISEHDFLEAGAGENDLPDVVEELISFIPGVEIAVLFYQKADNICVLVNTLKNQNALYLASAFNPQGSKTLATFCLLGKTLLEAEKEVIDKIKEKLG